MGEATFEGHAICVADYEEDHLFLVGAPGMNLRGMTDFVMEAGGETVRSAVPNAFEFTADPEMEEESKAYWQGCLDKYREETGRMYPPVMKVKVTVVVENLTDEEAGKVWEEHVRGFLARRTGDPQEEPGVTEP